MIDGDKQNLNAGNSTDCADITISDYASDGLVATDIDAVDYKYCN